METDSLGSGGRFCPCGRVVSELQNDLRPQAVGLARRECGGAGPCRLPPPVVTRRGTSPGEERPDLGARLRAVAGHPHQPLWAQGALLVPARGCGAWEKPPDRSRTLRADPAGRRVAEAALEAPLPRRRAGRGPTGARGPRCPTVLSPSKAAVGPLCAFASEDGA